MRAFVRGAAFVALSCVLACAQGTDPRTVVRDAGVRGVDGGLDAGTREDAGTLVDAGFGLDAGADDAGMAPDGGADVLDGGASGADAGVDSGTDAGVDAGTDAGVDAGPLCPVSGTCATPRPLGSMDGDQGTASLETTGLTDEWLSVTVVDNGSVWNGDRTVRVSFELESTGDARYELVTYRAATSATPLVRECTANESVGSERDGMQTLALSWSDVTNGIFASDGDGRIVSVRVRHVSGPCEGGWRLVAYGNR
ncbi:MAG: hypothetical protein H6721_11830 [Sandaracinus sp.]|nr:hypothetical protein [Sandaracinus sp.]MCB9620229.1 hypothetical protein [Sandaracinus sp.]MCB9632812.1 hypothetical protein [Sandaracinus sp.]